MAEKETRQVQLKIITPEEKKVDEMANMVIIRCTTGDMGILYGHEARSAVLDMGVLRIFNDEGERRIAVFGGLAEIRNNVVTILANSAQWPEDIDRAAAEEKRERVEQLLRESQDSMEVRKNQLKLRKTLVAIEVSSYPLISAAPKKE